MKKKENKINKDLKLFAKKIVNNAKKLNIIGSHQEAFKDFPVKFEIHKGKAYK